MNSRKILNKDVYDIYKKLQFPKRTAMLERPEKVYNKMETYNIENSKEWDYHKRSINHQVKKTDRV